MNKATVPRTRVTSSSPDPRWRSRVRQAKSTAGSGGGGSRTGFREGGTTAVAAAAATASMLAAAVQFRRFAGRKAEAYEAAKGRLPCLRDLLRSAR